MLREHGSLYAAAASRNEKSLMSERFTAVFAASFALAVLAPVVVPAATLPVKADAHVGDRSSNANSGASANVNVDGAAPYSKLLRFALPAGPVSSDASNATLYLFVNHVASTSGNVASLQRPARVRTAPRRTAPAQLDRQETK